MRRTTSRHLGRRRRAPSLRHRSSPKRRAPGPPFKRLIKRPVKRTPRRANKREMRMSNRAPNAVMTLAGVALTALVGSSVPPVAMAQQPVSIRNLTPYPIHAWLPDRPTGDDFLPPPSGPGPVMSRKDRPYVPNGRGQQPTYRIADLTNPILKPWAIEQMKKANEEVDAGKVPYITREHCWPAGVPGF